MKQAVTGVTVVSFVLGIFGCSTSPAGRTKLCVESEQYKLHDNGHSWEDAKVGAAMNCSAEIQAAIVEEKKEKK